MRQLRNQALIFGCCLAGMAACTAGCSDGTVGDPSLTATGGSAGAGGATGTGGSTTTGGGGSGASATGGGSVGGAATTFTFYAIGDPRSNWDIFEDNIRSMVTMDPDAVGTFSAGDLTPTGEQTEWDDHHNSLAQGAPDPSVPDDPMGIVRQSHFRTEVTDWGPYNRYLGVMGNHDDGDGNWHQNWNDYLVGQSNLGVNTPDGIYYTVTYQNALFIALDSINDSPEQTAWLDGVLQSPEAAAATWKFAFFHQAVYPCNYKSPFDNGLEWVELFEQHALDIVFVADSHTYERTCPMIGGVCASGGVIYLNSSGAGAGTRDVENTRVETISHGGRTDTYDCAQILDQYQGNWHHFTHLTIEGCRLTASAYSHDWHATQEAAFDTLVIDKCGG